MDNLCGLVFSLQNIMAHPSVFLPGDFWQMVRKVYNDTIVNLLIYGSTADMHCNVIEC